MATIKRGADIYRAEGRRDTAEAIIDLVREKGGEIAEPGATTNTGVPVVAFIDHGRWLGECGLWDAARARICKNAQYIDEDDPRFFCITCLNAEVGGQWREVTWPTDTDIVEGPLIELPADEQNWTPEE